MLIVNFSIVKPVSTGKTKPAHELQGISDKIGCKWISALIEQLVQFTDREVLLILKKNFKNLESIFKIIDVFLLKEFFELFFLTVVNAFHMNSSVK